MKFTLLPCVAVALLGAIPAFAQEPAPPPEPAAPAAASAPATEAPAPARTRPAPRPSPSYRWIELSYAIESLGDEDFAVKDQTLRISGNLRLARQLYLLASYNDADYADEFSLTTTSGGLGFHGELGHSVDGILNLTYEQLDFGDEKLDGYGLEAGVRWITYGRSEIAFSYKMTQVESNEGDEVSLDGINIGTVVPINRSFSLSLRAEKISGGDALDGIDLENFLIGARFRF